MGTTTGYYLPPISCVSVSTDELAMLYKTLTLRHAEIKLLATALNNVRLFTYTDIEREQLPTLGRKLADYLAEPYQSRNPKK